MVDSWEMRNGSLSRAYFRMSASEVEWADYAAYCGFSDDEDVCLTNTPLIGGRIFREFVLINRVYSPQSLILLNASICRG